MGLQDVIERLWIRTSGDASQHDLLCCATTEGHANHVLHLFGRHQQVLAGEILRKSQGCTSSGHDADLQQWLRPAQEPGSNSVAGLMECDCSPFVCTNYLQDRTTSAADQTFSYALSGSRRPKAGLLVSQNVCLTTPCK